VLLSILEMKVSTLMLPPTYINWRLSFRFPNQHLVCISLLSCACYMPHPLYHRFDHSNYNW
jgi:hypothetical protein